MELSLHSRFSRVCSKIKNHPFLLALSLNLLALVFRLLVFDVKYEVSDDFYTDAVLSGAFGNGYDPDLLFGNIILGYLLVFLYKLIPTISFYFVLLLVLGFASTTAIVFLLFKKRINVVTICISIVFISCFTDDLYILVQFTKAATAAGIAGGLLILYSLWDAKTHKYIYLISGLILMILGIMVRFSAIYIFATFLVVVFACYCIRYVCSSKEPSQKGKGLSKVNVFFLLKRFLVCFVIIAFMFVLQYLGTWLSNLDEGHNEFNKFHDLRYKITDINRPEYEEVENDYQELGLDYLDYVMLNSWGFDDRDVYSDEILQKVAEIQQRAIDSKPITLYDAFKEIAERCVLTCPAAVALYILAISVITLDKKPYYSILLVIASILFEVGFVYFGRTVYRVEWSVLFCGAACLIACFDYSDINLLSKLKINAFQKDIRVVSVVVLFVTFELLFVRVPRIFTSNAYLNCSYDIYFKYFCDTMLYSGEYNTNKYSCPTVTRKPYPNLIDYMKADTEHFYYVDFGTGIQTFYYNFDPWIRPEQGLFCNDYAIFGSCTMSHPDERYALEYNGCDPKNPFKSLVNENVLLVDGWGSDYKLEYVQRYYYPDAKIELYDVVDGYKIWNIYVP